MLYIYTHDLNYKQSIRYWNVNQNKGKREKNKRIETDIDTHLDIKSHVHKLYSFERWHPGLPSTFIKMCAKRCGMWIWTCTRNWWKWIHRTMYCVALLRPDVARTINGKESSARERWRRRKRVEHQNASIHVILHAGRPRAKRCRCCSIAPNETVLNSRVTRSTKTDANGAHTSSVEPWFGSYFIFWHGNATNIHSRPPKHIPTNYNRIGEGRRWFARKTKKWNTIEYPK